MEPHRLTHDYDKTRWPRGPWDTEPDRVDFDHLGLPCFLLRNTMGAWCGYAGVPPAHPFSGLPYDDMNEAVNVHGGLTYSGECDPPLCHAGDEAVWWFGFDTAHAWDLVPALRFHLAVDCGEVYRSVDYAMRQTRLLAEQLVALAAQKPPAAGEEEG
jgi:hypothetical protein